MNPQHFRPLRMLAVVWFLAVFVSCTGYHPSAVPPTPTPVPQALVAISAASLPLSGEWRFSVDRDQTGEANGWAEPDFDDSAWIAVTVLHTWGVMPEDDDYDGSAWYRRRFMLPPQARDAHLRLHFGAVSSLARVWLNGHALGEHAGGEAPFDFDVSRVARPGADNVLVVRLDNLQAIESRPAPFRLEGLFDEWNSGGRGHAVSLEVTSRAFIARQAIVAVPQRSGGSEADSATITTTVTVNNTSVDSLTGLLTANILDEATGQPVLTAPATAPISLAPGRSAEIQLAAVLASPTLWRADRPRRYRWVTTLTSADAKQLHVVEETFSIHSVKLDAPEAEDVLAIIEQAYETKSKLIEGGAGK